jgi:hypothetical protein
MTVQGLARRTALPMTEKAPEQSGSADVRMPVCESKSALRLVWGPGAGVEAAGGLCFSRNETGVVCIP